MMTTSLRKGSVFNTSSIKMQPDDVRLFAYQEFVCRTLYAKAASVFTEEKLLQYATIDYSIAKDEARTLIKALVKTRHVNLLDCGGYTAGSNVLLTSKRPVKNPNPDTQKRGRLSPSSIAFHVCQLVAFTDKVSILETDVKDQLVNSGLISPDVTPSRLSAFIRSALEKGYLQRSKVGKEYHYFKGPRLPDVWHLFGVDETHESAVKRLMLDLEKQLMAGNKVPYVSVKIGRELAVWLKGKLKDEASVYEERCRRVRNSSSV